MCDCLGGGSSLTGNASSSEDGPMEGEESTSSTGWGEPTGAERNCDFEIRANLNKQTTHSNFKLQGAQQPSYLSGTRAYTMITSHATIHTCKIIKFNHACSEIEYHNSNS